ncbi:MAG TPA: YkgJ family cysteine cluster protein [Tepidisphaeraceae bacterium]|jgi:lysine-N-methylase|nr:YkgJ family cysteine cluster protein [Tepidisphaeraceae bacterium]
MKLTVLPGENFSCRSCTDCCRSWFVELMPGERERIEKLAWPADDPARKATIFLEHSGKTYLARRSDGACLFLNESNNLCRIHEQFGFDAKPIGCRVFPFQIAPTFKDQATVIGRFDCPTVRQNLGASHADALPDLKRYTNQLNVASSGFDEWTSCRLEPEQIQDVSEFILTLMNGFATNEQRAIFIAFLCDVLSQTASYDVDRVALAKVFPGLKKLVEGVTAAPVRRPNWFHRMAFRTLLGLYLRRDEDVLNGRAGKISRVLALIKIVLGRGSFHSLGLSHPPGKLRRAHLFKPLIQPRDPAVFGLFWRMIRNRLESFQFMGPANNNRDFLNGLRSLALLYPLVVAAAKYNAGNRNASTIEPEDVDYAVAAIEHSFGRLAVLNQSFTRRLEKLLLDQKHFGRLARSV